MEGKRSARTRLIALVTELDCVSGAFIVDFYSQFIWRISGVVRISDKKIEDYILTFKVSKIMEIVIHSWH